MTLKEKERTKQKLKIKLQRAGNMHRERKDSTRDVSNICNL